MKIKILLIGKTKEEWQLTGEKEYEKRLRKFCDLERKEIPEEKMTPSISPEMVKKREAEKMLAQLSPDFFIVALSPNGKTLSSEQFAAFLGKVRDREGGKLCFLIGGPLGLGPAILQRADEIISFSMLTFPHDLFRIILLEQLYRGFSILADSPYHRA